jgi:Cu-Zn family superoxide dismutase
MVSTCLNFIAVINENKIKGTVSFHQCTNRSKVIVKFDLKGFKPNSTHACHIHEFGDTTNGCISLGAHLNLTNTTHGSIYRDIYSSHTGDLINNIKSDNNGNFKFMYEDPRLMMFVDITESIICTSIVIHEGIDDLGLGGNAESLKTGNAGGRMCCGIIAKSKNGKLN